MKIEEAKERIRNYQGAPVRIMEVCGTHTHENFRLGIRKLLPETVTLISGPGCPVCVTEPTFLDEAIWLSQKENVVICTFGDLIRVPGSGKSLTDSRAEGAQIQIVYSPLDAVEYACCHPEKEVIFLSVGFETTTPAACLALKKAQESSVPNFSLLTANKTMHQAYPFLKGSADAFLYPGHVNAIVGEGGCRTLTENGISGVIAGFTAKDLLTAIAVVLQKLPEGIPFFENAYKRVVRPEGNQAACQLMETYMEPCDAVWRGLGKIEGSGLQLKEVYASFDARKKFAIPQIQGEVHPLCRCGEVLRGSCAPDQCGLFGKGCTPQHPVGACMVSNEGACAAYFQYGEER